MERQVVHARERLEIGVVGENDHQIAAQEAGVAVAAELLEAVRLLGHQHAHALALRRLSAEAHRDLHADLVADLPEPDDQVVEGGVQVGQVDQHGHDEEPFHDPLLDVLDVGVARREVRRDPGDDPLLVTTDDRDDGEVARGHAATLSAAPRGSQARAAYAGDRPVRFHQRTPWPGACRKTPPSR